MILLMSFLNHNQSDDYLIIQLSVGLAGGYMEDVLEFQCLGLINTILGKTSSTYSAK